MPAATAAIWPAVPHGTNDAPRTPNRPGDGWLPLVAAPTGDSPGRTPSPGWARVSWEPAALHLDALFHGPPPHNRATALNERTWELGDACELFVQLPGADYIEIHVTPENQRLQLRWPPGALARVRAKQETLETFLVADPGWIESRTRSDDDTWFTHATVPASVLKVPVLRPGLRFRAAVCRYECSTGRPEPVLSTTAILPTPGFHQPAHWHELVLQPAAGA